jgi:hypothetical protein
LTEGGFFAIAELETVFVPIPPGAEIEFEIFRRPTGGEGTVDGFGILPTRSIEFSADAHPEYPEIPGIFEGPDRHLLTGLAIGDVEAAAEGGRGDVPNQTQLEDPNQTRAGHLGGLVGKRAVAKGVLGPFHVPQANEEEGILLAAGSGGL